MLVGGPVEQPVEETVGRPGAPVEGLVETPVGASVEMPEAESAVTSYLVLVQGLADEREMSVTGEFVLVEVAVKMAIGEGQERAATLAVVGFAPAFGSGLQAPKETSPALMKEVASLRVEFVDLGDTVSLVRNLSLAHEVSERLPTTAAGTATEGDKEGKESHSSVTCDLCFHRTVGLARSSECGHEGRHEEDTGERAADSTES
jgi:hypothetical protein